LFLYQRPGDGRVLASVHQQRGQRGPIQESSGLGRRLTRAGGLFFLIAVHSLLLQRIACIFLIFFFYLYLPFKQISEKKKLIYVYFFFFSYI